MKRSTSGRATVVYFNSVPSPYVVERFELIQTDAPLSFSALFEMLHEPGRSWAIDPETWQFNAETLQDHPFRALVRSLRRSRPDVFVTLYHAPLYLFAAVIARFVGAKVIFRVLRTHESWNRRRAPIEALKHLAFTMLAQGFEVSGPDAASYAEKYCHRRNVRTYRTRQSIDLSIFRPDGDRIALGDERSVRFIYAGRMLRAKGIFELLAAFDATILKTTVACELIMIGDGADLAEAQLLTAGRADIHWIPFVPASKLAEYYRGADVFVFPTHGDPFGLVLTEAMACGLPVISTAAAGELEERILVPKTGYVVEIGADGLSSAMMSISQNASEREQMARRAVSFGASQGHPVYVKDFTFMISSSLQLL